MKSMPKARLNIRVDQSTLDTLKQIAKGKNRTVSSVANEILKKEKSCIPPATESNPENACIACEPNSTPLIDTIMKQEEIIDKQESACEMPFYTRAYIRSLVLSTKVEVNNEEMTVLDFIRKCRKRMGLNELKTLLKRSTLEELSKTLWR